MDLDIGQVTSLQQCTWCRVLRAPHHTLHTQVLHIAYIYVCNMLCVCCIKLSIEFLNYTSLYDIVYSIVHIQCVVFIHFMEIRAATSHTNLLT